jgi:hypothetical protein
VPQCRFKPRRDTTPRRYSRQNTAMLDHTSTCVSQMCASWGGNAGRVYSRSRISMATPSYPKPSPRPMGTALPERSLDLGRSGGVYPGSEGSSGSFLLKPNRLAGADRLAIAGRIFYPANSSRSRILRGTRAAPWRCPCKSSGIVARPRPRVQEQFTAPHRVIGAKRLGTRCVIQSFPTAEASSARNSL